MKHPLNAGVLKDSLRSQLWPVPLVAVCVAVVLGQYLPFLDRSLDDQLSSTVSGLLFSGGPESARSLMETIAGSLVTVTSLTFSLTVVTLQLASSQFSPRLLRTFTRDRFVHNTLALFLMTFVFALTVLRSIRVETSEAPGFVPEISVTVAFILAIASIIALVLFLAHLARQIRVETMLRDVHSEANGAIDRIFPEPAETPEPGGVGRGPGFSLIESDSSGFMLRLDPASAVEAAVGSGTFIMVDGMPGSSLIEGVPFARAWSTEGGVIDDERRDAIRKDLNKGLTTDFERTSTQDAGFGLQQLLDVASRALSPGVNDPTTAVHALAHISSTLCTLARRNTGPKSLRDKDGTVRVILCYPTFANLLDQAMQQMLRYGMGDPRTAGRTVQMLREMAWTDRQGIHSETISLQLGRVRKALADSGLNEHERYRLLTDCETVETAIGSYG